MPERRDSSGLLRSSSQFLWLDPHFLTFPQKKADYYQYFARSKSIRWRSTGLLSGIVQYNTPRATRSHTVPRGSRQVTDLARNVVNRAAGSTCAGPLAPVQLRSQEILLVRQLFDERSAHEAGLAVCWDRLVACSFVAKYLLSSWSLVGASREKNSIESGPNHASGPPRARS